MINTTHVTDTAGVEVPDQKGGPAGRQEVILGATVKTEVLKEADRRRE